MTPERPDLRPPGTLPEASGPARGSRLAIWMVLILLVGLAVAVVILLPSYTAPVSTESAGVPPTQTAATPVAPAPLAVSDAKPQAEQALRDYLRLRARMELENAPVWGDPEWDEAAAEVQRGDRLFVQNAFDAANNAYRQASARLEALDASRAKRLDEALRNGAQALAEERVAAAVEYFELALAIDAEDAQAVEGLARTRVREQVLTLMASGRQAEEQGELDAAQAAYREAAELDDAYTPAAEAMRHVAAEIERVAFQSAMDTALAALESGSFPPAAQALAEAAALRPDDASVRDLRLRLEIARKQRALANWRSTAQSKAGAEDWSGTLKAYEQALKVDPKAAFATAGAEQARARLRLHRQIDHYLESPARLAGDEPLANAEKVLQAAGEAPVGQPRLGSKLDQLRRLVDQARTPVTVELRSDGETDVVIYHVGRRGRFLQQRIELRPGTYTMVGSRVGYRDVRRQFEVRPDGPPLVVTIRCEEMI